MTVHCLEIMASKNIKSSKSPAQLKQIVQNYLDNNVEALPEQKSVFSSGESVDGGVQFYRGMFRLVRSSDGGTKTKAQVKNDMEGFLSNNFDWWQWRYHECTHDGTGGACSWQASNDSGNVPGEVQY